MSRLKFKTRSHHNREPRLVRQVLREKFVPMSDLCQTSGDDDDDEPVRLHGRPEAPEGYSFACKRIYSSNYRELIVAELDDTGRFTILAAGYNANVGHDCLRGYIGGDDGYCNLALSVVRTLGELGIIQKKDAERWVGWFKRWRGEHEEKSNLERLRAEALRFGYRVTRKKAAG